MRRMFTITYMLCIATVASASDWEWWRGTATVDGESIPVNLRIDRDGNRAKWDLPEYRVFGAPLGEVEISRSSFSAALGEGKDRDVIETRIRRGRMEGTWILEPQGIEAGLALEATDDDRPYTEEEDVVFHNGDVRLAGNVFVPKTPGPHPAIVCIHGSGPNTRERLEYMADFFARQGLVSLFFDKRGEGGSTGDWETVGFEPLAEDGIAAVQYLESRPDVDAQRVGLWGISQAGWIMPLAAHKAPEIDFVIVTSGATVNVEEEGYFDFLVRLRDAGYSKEDEAAARKLLELDFQVSMTGEGYEELQAMARGLQQEPWYPTLNYFPTPPHFKFRHFYRLIGDFDPVPILKQIDLPMLWLYGEADTSVDAARSIGILEPIIADGDRPWTIRAFPNANHGIRVPPAPGSAFPFRAPAPGYFEAMAEWLAAMGYAGALAS